MMIFYRTLLFVTLTLCSFLSVAQKPGLNLSQKYYWPGAGSIKIDDNGKYFCYTVTSQQGKQLIVQSTKTNYKKIISGATEPLFTIDSRLLLFKKNNDTVGVLNPGRDALSLFSNAQMTQVGEKASTWLVYKKGDSLYLHNLLTTDKIGFSNVKEYKFDGKSETLLLLKDVSGNPSTHSISWFDLNEKKEYVIDTAGTVRVSSFAVDDKKSGMAYLSKLDAGKPVFHLMYFNKAARHVMDVSNEISILHDVAIDENSTPEFCSQDSKILFYVRTEGTKARNYANVDVWNYKDSVLQSLQLEHYRRHRSRSFKAIFDVTTKKFLWLEDVNVTAQIVDRNIGEYAVLTTIRDNSEADWNEEARHSISLLSLKTGERKIIKDKLIGEAYPVTVSPNGNYIVWFDRESKSYFSYQISNHKVINLTSKVPVDLYDQDDDKPGFALSCGIAGWLQNDEALLVYDNFDIWQIDPTGIRNPISLTKGLGRVEGIVFRIINFAGIEFKNSETIYLAAFNKHNKTNGFYSLQLGLHHPPQLLVMDGNVYYFPQVSPSSQISLSQHPPIKAKNANVFLVKRSNAKEYPNLFLSFDLIKFNSVTAIHPQRDVKWLKTELVKWPAFEGRTGQGILYKPEDFDSTKKYPVIFTFYEKNSDALNRFIAPQLSDGTLNIPYYVSNGYLVFAPDISYKIGKTGQSVYDYVVSAAKYFSEKSWVDARRMGLQGHSFGAYGVNYLVSHTNIFTAAAESAGPSDFVSGYGGLYGNGRSAQYLYETSQNRIGATLWERPDLYIENSPIFNADKVSTPILIMHNKNDDAVPWQQGVEWFTALRRLGKRAWMLQYDNEGHQLTQYSNQLDFSIRLLQFFDHYLKGAPAPLWMTKGVPAKLKGIESGLELDTEN